MAALGSGGGIGGQSILVAGSVAPWAEALAVRLGAKRPVTSTDYNLPILGEGVRNFDLCMHSHHRHSIYRLRQHGRCKRHNNIGH